MNFLYYNFAFLVSITIPVTGFSQEASSPVNPFYTKIEETKTIAQQKDILEKRIRLGIERNVGLNTKKDVDFYLNLDIPFEKQESFLEDIIEKNKEDKKAMLRFSRSCQKIQCVIVLTKKLSKDQISTYPFLLKNSLASLEPKQLKFLIKHQGEVAESLKKMVHLAQDEQVQRDLIFNTRFLGFYQVGIDFLESHPKMTESSIWTLLDYCVLQYLGGQVQESKSCLEKNKAKDPEFAKHLMYLDTITSNKDKPDREAFEKLKKKYESFDDENLKNQLLLFEILIFKSLDKIDFTKYNAENIAMDYFLGFSLLKALDALKKAPTKWYLNLKKNYSERFNDQYLLKVLDSRKESQKIVEHFGKNATISQALLLKKN